MIMKKKSRREQFYTEVGEAMSMNSMRCFINLDTLEVDVHPPEDFFAEEEEDTASEAMDNPDKFLAIDSLDSHESFRIMEQFAGTVKDRSLQRNLIHALERKRPFANFKYVIDNSPMRQKWFDFRDQVYLDLAKEWLDVNASDELKEKIKSLSPLVVSD